jgi:ribosomal protein S18 acetylase RimI-like enzyme
VNQVFAARIQGYMRAKAHDHERQAVAIPPFTFYYNPSVDYPLEGIILPDVPPPITGYQREDIERLCAAVLERGRTPYVQLLDTFAPGLPFALQLYNPPFVEQMRLPVMVCTPETLLHPPDVPGLTVVMASSESPLADIKDGWNVNSRGFDPQPVEATDAIAYEFRKTLITGRAFTAYLNGQAVAAGMFTEIRDSITELVGITTLAEYRGRGIGASLTAYMTRAAFDSGVEFAYLTAGNPPAQRVYERLGYRVVAYLLGYTQET